MKKSLLLVSLILVFTISALGQVKGHSIVVFNAGEDGYTIFRIPALFKTSGNTLLAICEARKRKGSDDDPIDLVLKRSNDGGKSWSGIEMIYSEKRKTIGNPVVFEDAGSGRLHLIFSINNKRIFHIYSDDGARTWSKPRDIGKYVSKNGKWRWIAPGPGVGVQINGDRIKNRFVVPCNYKNKRKDLSKSFSIYSDDGGVTWAKSNDLPPGTNEVQLTSIDGEKLLTSARMQKNRELTKGNRGLAVSKDGGASWENLFYSSQLPCPLCHGSVISLPTNEVVQSLPYYTDTAEVKISSAKLARNNLSLWFSSDKGRSWERRIQVHEGPSAYSCMTLLNDDEIGILYEGGNMDCYQSLIFSRIVISKLR